MKMKMKRGIISIIMTLVLALGPAGSVAAAVQTGETGMLSTADVFEGYHADGYNGNGDENVEETGVDEEKKDTNDGEETVEPENEGEEEQPGDETEEERPKDETEEEQPKDEGEEEQPKDGTEEEQPKDGTEEEQPKDGTEEEQPKDGTEEEQPKDEAEEEPKAPEEEQPKDEPKEDPKTKVKEDAVDPDAESEEEDPIKEPEVFKYTIKFNGNGATSGTMKDMVCEENKEYSLPSCTFVRTNYDFNGWNTKADGTGTSYDKQKVKDLIRKPEPEPDTDSKSSTSEKTKTKNSKSVGEEDASITLYAQWKEHPYTITYILNGGTNSTANPASYTITTATTTLRDPVKKYSVFEGWFTDAGFKTKAADIRKGSSGDRTFYAKWREYTYSVIYDGNGATSGKLTPQTGIGYSKPYTLKTNKFKKKGYRFASWNTKRKGTGNKYKDKAQVQSLSSKDGGKVTLYAQWTEENYKIKYHLKGGKNNSKNPKKYTIRTRTIVLKDPSRKGYTFLGWYKDKACTKKITKIKKGSTGDINVYAKWQVNRYAIKYYGNGETGGKMRDSKCRYGKEYKLRANNFKRTGYTFKNWNTKKKGTGKTYKNKQKISKLTSKDGKVIKLYAQWKPIKYKVKFHANGATSGSMKKISCTYDVRFDLPKNKYKRDGYRFKGWSTEDDGGGDHFDDRESVKNLTDKEGEVVDLYARWEYDSDDDDATIWNYLKDKIGNDYGVAGIMGNLYAESGLRSNNLENMYNERLGLSDEEYTDQVDSGEYGNFAYDSAGYGIAQWTFSTRKQGLLDFARDMGTSIGNLHTQLAYLWKELSETYGGLLESLRSATSVRDASDRFMKVFENPADQSEGAKQRRAGYGWNFFNKFR